MSDSLVLALQRLLREAGHDPGPIDGVRGPRTEAAARAWIAAQPVPPAAPSTSAKASGWRWDAASRERLRGGHPDIVRVTIRARELSGVPFVALEVKRTFAQQQKYLAAGTTRTLNSRHLEGNAVDAVPVDARGNPFWDNSWAAHYEVAGAFGRAAKELGIRLRWGGAWAGDFRKVTDAASAKALHIAAGANGWDGVHFELPA